MLEKLSNEELEFMETFFYPIATAECVFSDFDNLAAMEDTKLSHVRLGQYPLLSHEYLLDDSPDLSDKQNFQLRKNVADVWALGGRLFGKTLCVEKIDMLISMLLLEVERVGFSSYDAIHIRGVLEEVLHALEHHPIYRIYEPQINRSPSYRITLKNGYMVEGINMNLTGKNPGCFDKETEILTDDGWKYFENLTYQDKVLSMNIETFESSYENIDKIIKEPYCGFLKKLKSKTSEFLVTPNHRLLVKNNKKFEFIEADSHKLPKQIYSPSVFKWKGSRNKFISLNETRNSQLIKMKIDTDVFYDDYVYCVETNPYNTILVRRNGCVMWSGNSQFFQKHLSRLYIEECSFETDAIYKRRRDSVSENGCIYRIAGMTNFTKYSPCGTVFYDYSKRNSVVNLPQYINPKWDDKMKEEAIKDFGGEQSIGYRVFIKGEVVEDGTSVFDMERVRKSYNDKKKVKTFEVTKKNFSRFEDIIIAERAKNASLCIIFADVGESAPSEIGVIFQIDKKYRYDYNITLYNLTDKEQFKIFKWLAETLQANYIALDCTDGTGRAIYRSLEEVISKEHLIWVSFNEKLPIDFEKHEDGSVIFKNGVPVYKEEYVTDWSIKHLKDLLYNDKMELPLDHKLDIQLNSVMAMQSGTRTTYSCVAQENHLFQAFQVFSIAHWLCEFLLLKPIPKKSFCKSGV